MIPKRQGGIRAFIEEDFQFYSDILDSSTGLGKCIMAIEEVKDTGSDAQGTESKLQPTVSSAESSSSSTYDGPRAQVAKADCAFDTTEDPRYYKPIPEYEGAHRWDPDFEWTEQEEKAVVKKVCQESIHWENSQSNRRRLIGASAHSPALRSSHSSLTEETLSKQPRIICLTILE